MSYYAEFVLLPPLIQHIAKLAPSIELIIKHVNYIDGEKIFENDEIDFAFGIYPKIPENLIAEKLFIEVSVCLGCKKNPLLKKTAYFKKLCKG